tara:strand:- start:502 stop:927 length:426 start_codon:yes stop_codon:yes gene_type:complete
MSQKSLLCKIPTDIIRIILNYTSFDDRVYIKEVSLIFYREFSIKDDEFLEGDGLNNEIYNKYISHLTVINNERCLNAPNLYKFTRDCVINDYKQYYDKYGMQLCIVLFNSLYIVRRNIEKEFYKDVAAYMTADFLKYNKCV